MRISRIRGLLFSLIALWLCGVFYMSLSASDINSFIVATYLDNNYWQARGRPPESGGIPAPWPNSTIVSQPHTSNAETILLVVSTRENFDRREAIRETWASGHDNVYFVVGQACLIPPDQRSDPQLCNLNPQLEAVDEAYAELMTQDEDALKLEEEMYHDLIFTPMPESYRSLPHKLKEAYDFAIHHTAAKWIVKADDDFFVRIDTVSKYLRQFDASKPFVVGRIKEKDLVRRQGKWGEYDYMRRFYPPFAIGSAGHAVTRSVAEYVVSNKDKLFEYQGEDTSLAIWLDESDLQVTFKKTPVFDNKGRCNLDRFYVIGHMIGARRMKFCYNKSDEVQILKEHETHVDKKDQMMQWREKMKHQLPSGRLGEIIGGSREERLARWKQSHQLAKNVPPEERLSARRAVMNRAKEHLEMRSDSGIGRRGQGIRALISTDQPSEVTILGEEKRIPDKGSNSSESRQKSSNGPTLLTTALSESAPTMKSSQTTAPIALQSNSWPVPLITDQKMVVIIMSARRNTEKRAAIRETWAKGHDNVYFILTDACPFPRNQMHKDLECEKTPSMKHDPIFPEHKMAMRKEERALLEEQKEHRDMIYTPGIESYHGLVRKLKESYHWVVSNTKADWVVKADDDIFVRVDSVSRYLSSLSSTTPTVVGRIIAQARVATSGKWEDSHYRQFYYPPWPQGSCGYVVSRNIAEYVGSSKETLYEYQGEDSSLGIWLDESKLKETINWHNSRAFVNHGECDDTIALVIGHEITPEKMRACYKTRDEIEALPDHAFDDAFFDSIGKVDDTQGITTTDSSTQSLRSMIFSLLG